MNSASLTVVVVSVLFIVKRVLDFQIAVRAIRNYQGYRTLLGPFGLPGLIFTKAIRGITIGGFSPWLYKYRIFADFGSDIVSSVGALPTITTYFHLADPVAVKEVTSHRSRFPKPVWRYKALSSFGRNIVASEGDEWKRYRKLSAPAFSERNNKLVWDETVVIMNDLFDNMWGGRNEVSIDHAIEITLPIALFVIGIAGFGRRVSWEDDLVIPPGHKMAFKDALHVLSKDLVMKAIFPGWVIDLGPTERLRRLKTAFNEVQQYMFEMIDARKSAEKKEERYDLFSSLLDASEEEADGQAKLSNSELLGNIFVYLIAGHETTAHTLCFTLGLLALYEDEQEKLYKQIKSVIPDGTVPTYDQMDSLTQCMAVLYETLRLFPPGVGVPKYAAEDTTLTTTNAAGEKVVVPIPRNSGIILHVPGLHYNPRYWPEPYEFKPDRFLGNWPRDAFLPFSGGARACIGRRFFETEAVAVLTMLVSRYKIEVKDEPQFASETFEERKERVLAVKRGLSLTPVRVPLSFKRR